jgi:hypothetical protein
MTVSEYVKNKQAKDSLTFRVRDGKGCYVKDGIEISQQLVDDLYPTPDILNPKDNSDKRNLWMKDKKSY